MLAISEESPPTGAITSGITFLERQKRQAAGARLLRAGMSATDEAETPMMVGERFQTAFPGVGLGNGQGDLPNKPWIV